MDDTSDHRLPSHVVPSHYDLELVPDLHASTFSGRVTISVDIAEPTSVVTMNSAELVVTSATITDSSGAGEGVQWSYDLGPERLILTTNATLVTGPAQIHLAFDGVLNDKLRGFYRSTFLDDEGVTRTIATTQFESTSARRAFPCWDEPAFKATFGVSLVVAADLLAISSGPEVTRTATDTSHVRVQFAPTMKMSTYLLAFVVGPLEATEAIDVDGVPLRVIHPLGKGHLTGFAEKVAAFSLRHFTEYFDISYPGDKLDLVALPDFAFGAMENLGCITFREALLLLDETESTQPEQQRAADVIAHEIAHMWFGDLVTMTWWNGIWLKEAFATFCEMHATNAMRPDWLRWDDFSLSRSAAFQVDSLETTRPIEFDVVSPDDAEAMYDILTYEKGAAVVRMLEQFLGEDLFRDGIRHYLRTHAYANADTGDLWDAIEHVTKQPARQIMDSWIFQGGYPLVSVEASGGNSIRLRQERFTNWGHDDNSLWSVPLVLAVGHGETRRRLPVLLDTAEQEVDLGTDPGDWLVANADASGFYRVNCLGETQHRLVTNLRHLAGVERYGLLDDTWARVVAGRSRASEVIELIELMARSERDTSVWRLILSVLQTIDAHVSARTRENHRRTSLELITAALGSLTTEPVEGEPEQTGELRAALFETGGLLGDAALIARARELLAGPTDPARNAAAIRVVAANGGAEDFGNFARMYKDAATPQAERRYLFALPTFTGSDEIQRLLVMLDTDQVRSQDGGYVLGRGLGNVAIAEQIWTYVESNWDAICARYPENSIPRMVGGVGGVGDATVAEAIDAFFETHEVPQAGPSLGQHLERMRVTVRLRERLRSELHTRL